MRTPTLIALAVAALALPATAADYKIGALTIQSPWSRPAMAGMNGVGFMIIANAGAKPVKLMSAQSPAAATVEIHRSAMADGVMTMRRQDAGVEIPAGGAVAFAPGGYHFMLLGLKQPLAAGQKIPVTLVFENGRRGRIELSVQTASPKAAQSAAPEHQHH